jgi:hypothetical protein
MHRVIDFVFVILKVIFIYLLFCLIAYFVKIEPDTNLFEPVGLSCIACFHFYLKSTGSSRSIFITAKEIFSAFLFSAFCFVFNSFCSFGLFAFDAAEGSGCSRSLLLRSSTSFRHRFEKLTSIFLAHLVLAKLKLRHISSQALAIGLLHFFNQLRTALIFCFDSVALESSAHNFRPHELAKESSCNYY